MAPEIFMAGHKHSYVSDFYALGITAFQLMLGQRPYKPDTANLKAIVRMSTFIPPERYTDLAQIRRILINAQERKAPSAEFRYSQFLSRVSPEARDFVQMCLICNPKFRLGSEGMSELKNHPWFKGERGVHECQRSWSFSPLFNVQGWTGTPLPPNRLLLSMFRTFLHLIAALAPRLLLSLF